MRSRRGRLEIFLDVLASIEAEPDGITNLLTKTGLAYGLCKEVTDKLLNKELVTFNESIFNITPKGSRFLKRGLSLMKSLGIEQSVVLKRSDIWSKG